jgi:hypothetical protein
MTNETRNLIERVERLERQNRSLKRVGLSLLLLLSAIGLMGQAQKNKKVEAERFVLLDEQGRERADLSIRSKGVALVFLDEGGHKQMSLSSLTDTAGHGHASLALGEGAVGARYTLGGSNGDEWVKISDGGLFLAGKDTTRIVLSASGFEGPSIEVVDSQGYSAELGVSSRDFPSTGERQKSSAASLVLIGKDRAVLWSAP